jgi:hypothetical protein
MVNRFLAAALIALSLVAIAGCASAEVGDERGSIGVSSY